jgi:hypothetical protein
LKALGWLGHAENAAELTAGGWEASKALAQQDFAYWLQQAGRGPYYECTPIGGDDWGDYVDPNDPGNFEKAWRNLIKARMGE